MRDDRRLHRYDQVLLLPGILQDDGVGVVDVAINPAVRPEETRHRSGGSKQIQGLVERVGAWEG